MIKLRKKQKVDKFANFIDILRKAPLSRDAFVQIAGRALSEYGFDVGEIENFFALGLELFEREGHVGLATAERLLGEQEFCVVDIETTGSVRSGQIIEIGAIKLKGGEKIGHFSTLVFAPQVPPVITELTGITSAMLVGAPSLAHALSEFRRFLGQAVFVAHNVSFDFGFISTSLVSLGQPPLFNRRLCTVELARRTIESERYGLDVLKELLGIKNTHHRAYSDAISAGQILLHGFKKLPDWVHTPEDLITFSKTAPSLQLEREDIREYVEF